MFITVKRFGDPSISAVNNQVSKPRRNIYIFKYCFIIEYRYPKYIGYFSLWKSYKEGNATFKATN